MLVRLLLPNDFPRNECGELNDRSKLRTRRTAYVGTSDRFEST